jgi:DNA-binding transcriptional ArsR family regulator
VVKARSKSEPIESRLDSVFGALSDPTRRSIVLRLCVGSATVSELSEPFAMSLPAVSKHLSVLQQAGIVRRERDGRAQRCYLEPAALETASQFIDRTRAFWESTLDELASYLEQEAAPVRPSGRSKVRGR